MGGLWKLTKVEEKVGATGHDIAPGNVRIKLVVIIKNPCIFGKGSKPYFYRYEKYKPLQTKLDQNKNINQTIESRLININNTFH